MGHGALICRTCGGEWSLRELGDARDPASGATTCPRCRGRSFGT